MQSASSVLGLLALAVATGGLACGSSSSNAHPSSSGGASGGETTGSAGSKTNGGSADAGSANGGTAAGSAAGGQPNAGGQPSAGGSANPSGGFSPADIPAVGTPGVDYVSDLQWKSAVVYSDFGQAGTDSPIGKDQTVNGKTPLVINGVSYAKGLGVKTYTEITYDLGGKYKQFISDTGLDFQENSSTMIFELKVDGQLVYDGGNKTSNKTQVEHVTIDVTGKSTLLLYVRDGFDDKAGDLGIWGGARLIK